MMKRTGWFKESFRHSLAARGVKTNYFADKRGSVGRAAFVRDFTKDAEEEEETINPRVVRRGSSANAEDIAKKSVASRMAKDLLSAEARAERPTDEALFALNRGDSSLAVSRYKALEGFMRGQRFKFRKTPEEQETLNVARREMESLRVSLGAEATRRARRGLSVSGEIRDIVGGDVDKELGMIEEERARERESPFKTGVREFAREEAARIVSGKVVTEPLGQALSTGAAGLAEGAKPIPGAPGSAQDFPGLFDDRVTGDQGLRGLPFFTTNVFVGNEEDGFLNSGTPPRIAGGIDRTTKELVAARAAAGGRPVETSFDKVKSGIDQVYGNLGEFSSIDTSAFGKGNSSFERGDREGLIEAITDLKSEEGKLHDRWTIVGQLHAQLIDPATVSSAYAGSDVDNLVFMKSGGAASMSDATRKLNKVKKDLKVANDQVAARRKMLEFSLQRLDSVVPDVTAAPKEVKVFKESALSGYSNPLLGSGNPVLGRSNDETQQ